MSTWQGRIVCDRCGGTIPDGSLMEGVQVQALSPARKVITLNFCLRDDDDHDGCAAKVFDVDALAYWVENRAGHTVPDLYDPDADTT